MWEFPKIRGTLLQVPILRIIVYWGLCWATLILGNYHVSISRRIFLGSRRAMATLFRIISHLTGHLEGQGGLGSRLRTLQPIQQP